ncbi:MAG: glycosyltransferase family 25 protein [Marinibacterium sp.]
MNVRSTPAPGQSAEIHAAVVNLDRAAERRERMRIQLDGAGVVADFFSAFDAREPRNADRLAAQPDHGPWGAVAVHDKACTQSHLLLMQAFLASKATYCLVLEDDAFLSPELGAWLGDLSWWPLGAEMVKLERWRDDKLYLVMDRAAKTHLGRQVARLWSRHSGTAGYIISRSGAKKVVAVKGINMPIDHLLFNVNISPLARSLVTYQVHPALVVQGNDPTPASAGTRAQTGKPAENKLIKDLRRGWHEIKVIPGLAARCLMGGATARQIAYQAHTIKAGHPVTVVKG